MDYNNDITELSQALGDKLVARATTVTVAESCTAGGLAEAITRIPGSSRWFEIGFITYSNRAKSRLLGVDEEVLFSEGAVSRSVAEQMATGALRESQAGMVAAVTGIAGPGGGSEEKPVGTVWFAWATDEGEVLSVCNCFAGDRQSVRQQSVIAALKGLIDLCDPQSAV